jgi:MFS family permease
VRGGDADIPEQKKWRDPANSVELRNSGLYSFQRFPFLDSVSNNNSRHKHHQMPSCCEALSEGKARIKTLFFQSPRELWVIYLVLFLESFAVFSTSLILTNFLTDEYGYSDSQAGFAYGLYGTLVSVFSVLVGTLVDVLGVRKSLLLSATILTCSRIAIALVRNSTVVIALMYTTIPLGMAICSPAQLTGLRRFTTPITQPFAFSLFYVAMNVAALFSGWMVDILRAALEVSSSSASSANCAVPTAFPTNSSGVDPTPAPVVHSELGPYRVLILIGASTTILQLLLIAFLMRPKNQDSNEDSENSSNREIAPEPESRSYLEMLQDIFCEPEHRFWRFLLFVALLTGVKQVFRHLDATVPKYLIRSAGCSAPFGLIYSLNPFLIIILVPLITRYD